jgi:hypothetical protein
MSWKSHKTLEIKVLLLFCLMIEGSGSVKKITNSDPRGSNYWAGRSTALALAFYFLTLRIDQKQTSWLLRAQKILIGNVSVPGTVSTFILSRYIFSPLNQFVVSKGNVLCSRVFLYHRVRYLIKLFNTNAFLDSRGRC